MASYDRADWHYGGDYPKDLPPENGGTHIGMFLAWIIQNGLIGTLHRDESSASLEAVQKRQMTGREFLIKNCDEKFWEEDLSDEGNRFAKAYYSGPEGKGYGLYINDYQTSLANGLPSIYHVPDTWISYDKLSPIITRRFQSWKKSGKLLDKPWWRVW